MTPNPAPGSLLVIVPAYNEEAAIAGVVREIQESIPGVPVLVIDDCSMDSTVQKAHAALLGNLGRLWRQRRQIREKARITPAVFRHLMRCHGLSVRRVAEL